MLVVTGTDPHLRGSSGHNNNKSFICLHDCCKSRSAPSGRLRTSLLQVRIRTFGAAPDILVPGPDPHLRGSSGYPCYRAGSAPSEQLRTSLLQGRIRTFWAAPAKKSLLLVATDPTRKIYIHMPTKRPTEKSHLSQKGSEVGTKCVTEKSHRCQKLSRWAPSALQKNPIYAKSGQGVGMVVTGYTSCLWYKSSSGYSILLEAFTHAVLKVYCGSGVSLLLNTFSGCVYDK